MSVILLENLMFVDFYALRSDIMYLNVMMDAEPLHPEPFHPRMPRTTRDYKRQTKPRTRTECPVRYYITDFGISLQFEPGVTSPLAEPWIGGVKTAPEFQNLPRENLPPTDPFPTDVWYLGYLIRALFLDVSPVQSCSCLLSSQTHRNRVTTHLGRDL